MSMPRASTSQASQGPSPTRIHEICCAVPGLLPFDPCECRAHDCRCIFTMIVIECIRIYIFVVCLGVEPRRLQSNYNTG